MKHLFKKNILFKEFIVIFALIMILPTTMIVSISYYFSVKQTESQVSDYLTQIVKKINSEMDNLIRDYEFFSKQLSISKELMEFLNLQPDEYFKIYLFEDWLEHAYAKEVILQKPIVDSFSIISDTGAKYFSHTVPDAARVAMLKEKLPPNGDISVFAYQSPLSNTFVVNIGRRIYSSKYYHQTAGSFIMDINTAKLNELWENVDLKGGYICIADSDGTIIYHPDPQKSGTPLGNFLDMQLFKNEKSNFTIEIENTKYFASYHTSAYTHWTMLAVIPMEKLKQPLNRQKNHIILACMIVFVFTSVFAYIFILSIINPIKKLKKVMLEVGQGHWVKVGAPIPENELGEFMEGFNFMVEKISRLVTQVYESELIIKNEELARKTAQLQALQLQINPHFLYNTLGAVNAYSLTNQTVPIQHMIVALGSMLRYAIQSPFEPVRVRDEINHLNHYFIIQKYRQVNMPKIYWDIEKYAGHPILRLVLQPIVENIFQHAFPDGIKAHHAIWIEAMVENGNFIIAIKDNGIGFNQDESGGPATPPVSESPDEKGLKGIGLSNVKSRLQLAYGPGYGLEIQGRKDYGTVVKLILPYFSH